MVTIEDKKQGEVLYSAGYRTKTDQLGKFSLWRGGKKYSKCFSSHNDLVNWLRDNHTELINNPNSFENLAVKEE